MSVLRVGGGGAEGVGDVAWMRVGVSGLEIDFLSRSQSKLQNVRAI